MTPYLQGVQCMDSQHLAARSLLILYGSQTGQAKGLAERLSLQGTRLFAESNEKYELVRPTIRLLSANDYRPLSRLPKERAILLFICSTTGHGEPPDNMRIFWNGIMSKSLPIGTSLTSSSKFAVLGLGNSSYGKYNLVAKAIFRRFVQLGASPIDIKSPISDPHSDSCIDTFLNLGPLGLADEQASLGQMELISAWVPAFWNSLAEYWGLKLDSKYLDWNHLESPKFVSSLPSKYLICEFPENGFTRHSSINNTVEVSLQDKIARFNGASRNISESSLFPRSDLKLMRVVSNDRFTHPHHFQDTRLVKLELDVSKSLF
ncbi:unnamed protein product [Protopolystoma xenopodis]|uniref:Flavodoxin-like domain-containing protein n=1 Tax=Protopolystoma xenopodis TaxID=117903 RepID=A0A3S5CKD1_9PLAT|nr:unnamed protein product [Protopolystoma xenopodis]